MHFLRRKREEERNLFELELVLRDASSYDWSRKRAEFAEDPGDVVYSDLSDRRREGRGNQVAEERKKIREYVGSADDICFNCEKRGHVARTCSEPIDKGKIRENLRKFQKARDGNFEKGNALQSSDDVEEASSDADSWSGDVMGHLAILDA